MKLSKIQELELAKLPFDISQKCSETIDYVKWIEFIEQNNFVWKEETTEGKSTIDNIDSIPEFFRERVLASLNKRTAYFDFDANKNQFRVNVTFRSEFNYVGINIEEKLSIQDLKLFFKMANHLDALLLKDGNQVIDEKIIESLS